jgi:hypothetical protein
MRIKVFLTTENLGCNLILFRGGSRMVPGVIGEIAQEFTKRLRPVKSVATEESLDLSELLGFLCHCDHRPGIVTPK